MTNIKRLSRRSLVKVLSFTAAAFFIVIGVALSGYSLAYNYRRVIENGYNCALDDLGAYARSIDVSLTKGIYAGTNTMLLQIAADLYSDSAQAKTSLSRLPQNGVDLTRTYRFLSQVGDYTLSLTKKVAQGGSISEDEWNSLRTLSGYAKAMAQEVELMRETVLDKDFINGEVKRVMQEDQLTESQDTSRPQSEENSDETPPRRVLSVGDGYDSIEAGFDEYPSLIYDGPFSDNVQQEKARLTEGEAEITASRALELATKVTSMSGAALGVPAEEGGNMPAYVFSGGDYTVAISKKGGFPIYMTSLREVGEQRVDAQRAVSAAQSWLEAVGYTSMKSTYYMITENICTVNFACREDAVTVYPDLIKVSVALDNGAVCAFDARGYIANHTDRELKEAAVTREQGLYSVSPLLTVVSARKAIIPTAGGGEVLCHEYNCRGSEDEKILVYVNAENGREERILILLESENGTLTM